MNLRTLKRLMPVVLLALLTLGVLLPAVSAGAMPTRNNPPDRGLRNPDVGRGETGGQAHLHQAPEYISMFLDMGRSTALHAGVELHELRTETTDLEGVFLSLTRDPTTVPPPPVAPTGVAP